MVHHIVRAHRGRITVQSDVGKGAAFHIFLPVAGGS
jgi:signal transduction histidine kinase